MDSFEEMLIYMTGYNFMIYIDLNCDKCTFKSHTNTRLCENKISKVIGL